MSDLTEILARQRAVLDIPLNQHLGIVYDGTVNGKAQLHFFSTPELASFGGQLHGGVLSTLFEVAGFLALVPLLKASQHAVTHDLHVSLMRPVPTGARCNLSAHVARFGKTLAFIEVSAYVEDKLVASARITKSIIGRPEF